MGKSRRNRGSAAARRRDPLSKPIKPPSDPELASLREAKIVPIIRDLQSADPKSRSSAASAVSSIIQDERCRKLLLREQVVHIVLSQTLTDSALESRAAGWGILQVLAQEEDADFCIHIYRLDILTAIEHAARAVTDALFDQSAKPSKAERSVLVSIVGSLVSLCTALAEAQDDILEAIAGNAAVNTLLFHLVTAKTEDSLDSLRSDTLACLMVLSEDNAKLAQRITTPKHEQVYQTLQALKGEVGGDGILSCAILFNVYSSLQGESVEAHVDNLDPSALVPTLAKAIASITADSPKIKGEDNWSNPIQYQQLALEVLASIGTSLNSEQEDEPRSNPKQNGHTKPSEDDDMEEAGSGVGDDDEEEEMAESDDEMDEDAMQADMDMVTGADDADEGGNGIDDVPVLKALLQLALPEVIRVVSLPVHDEESMRFQGLALSALNNVSWSVSMVDFDDEQNIGIQRAWTPTGKSIWQHVITPILSSDTADVTLAAQVTGLAWAVARTLRAETPLKPNEHRKFISLYQATRGTEVSGNDADPLQGLGVKCIGVLGQLALDPAPTDLNKEIGMFLVTLLASLPETPVADAVEALNQIFDIYADEEFAYDREVFWKGNFLKHLEDARPKAKAMVKTVDKRAHAELRTRADEALLNLEQFISYKNRHRP